MTYIKLNFIDIVILGNNLIERTKGSSREAIKSLLHKNTSFDKFVID